MPLKGLESRSVKHVPSRWSGRAIPGQKNVQLIYFAFYRCEHGASAYNDVSSFLLRENITTNPSNTVICIRMCGLRMSTKNYIHGSVHRNSILIISNKMQQYAGTYLLQNHSTCFGCPSHPSSGLHKTVTTASDTGHIIRATTFL